MLFSRRAPTWRTAIDRAARMFRSATGHLRRLFEIGQDGAIGPIISRTARRQLFKGRRHLLHFFDPSVQILEATTLRLLSSRPAT